MQGFKSSILNHLEFCFPYLQCLCTINNKLNFLNVVMWDRELYSNNISGRIPNELGNLTNLVSLDLYLNRLDGGIPDTLGKLQKLRFLYGFTSLRLFMVLSNLKWLSRESLCCLSAVCAKIAVSITTVWRAQFHIP